MSFIKRKLQFLILVLIISSTISAQEDKNDSLSALEIVQRAINNNGGDSLDLITAGESISQVITPEGDTLSIAVKRKDYNKYYVSTLSLKYENTTTIYNRGKAVLIRNERVRKITDPLKLEELLLQCYNSIDHAYKKLDYKLERLDDQKFDYFDCYTILATSPLGKLLLNYYDKKTGNLIMIGYPNGNKSVFTDYYQKKGIGCPSRILMVDTSNKYSQSLLTKIDYDESLDTNWFKLPAEGSYKAPGIFKEGKFKYINSNVKATVVRTKVKQVETSAESTMLFKIKWITDSDYIIITDPSNTSPALKNVEFFKVRIVSWQGKKYYCHYIGSNNAGGACAFEKIQ